MDSGRISGLEEGRQGKEVFIPSPTWFPFTIGRNEGLNWRLFKGRNDKLGPDYTWG